MLHNEIAAKFRAELEKRYIDVTVDEWDSIIYSFASGTQSLNNKDLVSSINVIIDSWEEERSKYGIKDNEGYDCG
jgi:hypothetical protein